MKNQILHLLYILVFITISCQDDSTEPDKQAIEVNLALKLHENAEVAYNTVKISATAADNHPIKRVTFFLGQDTLFQDNTEPFELEWNTRSVEDGSYVIRIDAYDKSGNKGIAYKEVIIQNTLLTISLASDYRPTSYEEWFYITDNEGNLIGDLQKITGSTLEWIRPAAFNSPTFYLNHLNYGYRASKPPFPLRKNYTYNLRTYADFNLNKIVIKSSSPLQKPTGTATITIVKDDDNTKRYAYSIRFPDDPYSATRYSDQNPFIDQISAPTESTKALILYQELENTGEEDPAAYYLFKEILAGGSYTFHTSEFNLIKNGSIRIPSEIRNASLQTFVSLSSYFSEKYFLEVAPFLESEHVIRYQLTDNPNHHFGYIINATTDSYNIYHTTYDNPPQQLDLPTNFSLELNSKNIESFSASIKGEFDIACFRWSYSENKEDEYISMYRDFYTDNKPITTYQIPPIPDKAIEMFPHLAKQDLLTYNRTTITKYAASNSYKEALMHEFTYQYSNSIKDSEETVVTFNNQ